MLYCYRSLIEQMEMKPAATVNIVVSVAETNVRIRWQRVFGEGSNRLSQKS